MAQAVFRLLPYSHLIISINNEIQTFVLLLLFQHVSASCLGVFLFDLACQLSSTASLISL